MRAEQFKNPSGTLVNNVDGQLSYIPHPLPPTLDWRPSLITATHRATQSLAQLNGLTHGLPNPQRLVRMFLRREAEASSTIEQTYARVRTMLLFEHVERIADAHRDVVEVENNFRALVEGCAMAETHELSLSLIRRLHEVLFTDGDERRVNRGRFRSVPVYIGSGAIEDAKFVPPPPLEVEVCMRQLVDYARAKDGVPPVVRAAIIHQQFETIHPFNDGNGRIGRILTLFCLRRDGAVHAPFINPSAGLERRRRDYYDLLLNVSTHSEWSEWIAFFADTLAEEANRACEIVQKLAALRQKYHDLNRRKGVSSLHGKLIDDLFADPAITTRRCADLLGISLQAATRIIEHMMKLGILEPADDAARNRVFIAQEIVDLFSDPIRKTKKAFE